MTRTDTMTWKECEDCAGTGDDERLVTHNRGTGMESSGIESFGPCRTCGGEGGEWVEDEDEDEDHQPECFGFPGVCGNPVEREGALCHSCRGERQAHYDTTGW